MAYSIHYHSENVQAQILALPLGLQARYVALTRRMIEHGPHLGPPHTQALGKGLFELRVKGAEGIARAFFCTLIGRRIMILHCFVKESDKTPLTERRIAESRLREIQYAEAQ